MSKPSEEHFRIILLGKRGSGKSATGNTLLAAEKFQTDSDGTKELKRSVTVRNERKEGKKLIIEVMDTPGFSGTKSATQEMKTTVVKSVMAYRPEFCIFVYVMKFNCYEKEDFDMYKRFLDLFGPEISPYTILLFTGENYLKEKKDFGEELQKLLGQNFPGISDDFLVFDNKTIKLERKKKQTDELLDKIRDAMVKTKEKPFQSDLLKEVDKAVRQAVKRGAGKVKKEGKKIKVDNGES